MMNSLKSRSAPPEIVIRDITFALPSNRSNGAAVEPISLEIGSGEFLSIIGPNSCLQTGLLKAIAGLQRVASGEVLISGNRVEAVQTNLGIVFREPVLMPWRSVIQNVLLQKEIRGIEAEVCEAHARRLLVMLGMSGHEDRKPHELQPGMAQRVSLCRALVHDPPLLLLDDPFRHWDPLLREQMAADLQRLQMTPRMTIVLTTTSAAEAVQLSDRIAVMSREGRVLRIISVELPRPRRLDKGMTPKITEFCNSIRTLLEAQGVLS